MKLEDYNKYSKLLERKNELEGQLEAIDSKYQNMGDRIFDIGWLELTFGNGSNRRTVLNNHEHMKEIAESIKYYIKSELNEVILKMDEL